MFYHDRDSHVVDAELGAVSPHDTIVDAVEDGGDPKLHDGVWVEGEEEPDASEDEEEKDVAKYSQSICDLVDEQEPPIHQSKMGGREWKLL